MSAHILVVEDEVDIAELIAFNLERQGWRTTLVHHGAEAVEQIRALLPDLVILDIMLPGMDGLQIFRSMKESALTAKIPALFLTARAQLEDRLAGLSLGADDYMTKPFSPKELVLRVRNILSRCDSASSQQLLVRGGKLVLDKNDFSVTLAGEPLELTTAEFRLLAYLMERPGKVQDRYKLQTALFGYADTTQSRTLDTHIKRLRQKLGAYATCIGTERGAGYYFVKD
ncbi:MAG: response regulator transcription factor [Akkermansiaceae bacterium]|nr:response regulator transcription factor [Akkermansiaceae bacterium]